MSTYNPLNDFNTFSYHHFLVMVNDSTVADKLNDSSLFFRFATGEVDIPGARILINPVKSVRYVIQTFEWTNYLSMDHAQFGGTIGSGGQFKIIEPNGMSFLNDLQDIFHDLGCGISTSEWVLKTVFVGQKNVGSASNPTVDYINNVKALRLQIVNMSASFTEAGGEYEFEFAASGSGAGVVSGAGISPLATNASVNLGDTDKPATVTVEQGIKALEDHINATTLRDYSKLVAVNALQPNGGNPLPVRTVYKIVMDESLKKPEYTLAVAKRLSSGPDNSAPILTVPAGTSVPATIMSLLKMSEQLMIESTTPGQRREQYVDSSSSFIEGKKLITYKVRERTIETEAVQSAKDGGSGTSEPTPAEARARESGNFLEFDYLFTGKNIDVLSYDMKMADGIGFLTAISSPNVARDDRSQSIAPDNVTSASNVAEIMSGSPQPHAPGTLPSTKAAHSTNPNAVTTYEQLLQQHSILKMLATLKIRGNPRLLNDITPEPSDSDDESMQTKLGVANNYGTQPVLCRINIRMPKDGELTNLQDFWYRGNYQVLSVTNIFASGEFTQELQMVAQPDGLFTPIPEPRPQPPAPVEAFSELPEESSVQEARIRAFLATIRFCEGTTGDNGYNTLFGGSLFDGFEDHPRTVIKTPRHQSSAAGAYQILTKTWDWISTAPSKYSSMLPDFRPESQDIAGWCLLDYRKALPAIRAGRIEEALYLCRKEWASLPDATYEGQPTKKMSQVLSVYNAYLQQELEGQTTLKVPQGVLV